MAVRSFRYDINGLRAWAVCSVILYHFGIPGFSGGFIGVDVFFVISGFLMAGIVVRGVERTEPGWRAQGRFLLDFWLARGRRIIPALTVVCVAVLCWGWFNLTPDDFAQQAKHANRAMLFRSNLGFAQEAGYFAAASHDKLLLHTWSLGVEWQFYLLFPIVVLGLRRVVTDRRRLAGLLALLGMASFAYGVRQTTVAPADAFFLLPSRAWELLVGALVFFAGNSLSRGGVAGILNVAGFGLIVAAVLFVDSQTPWPGYLALVPVFGSAMVLLAARQGSLLTRPGIVQWLGTGSYSLYLWHWPIVATIKQQGLLQDPAAIAAGLAATLVLGWLSYRLVEVPTRAGLRDLPPRRELVALVLVVLVAFVPGQFISQFRGVPARFTPEVAALFEERSNTNPRMMECQVNGDRPVPECTYGGPVLGAIVIGDSHAGAIIRSVEKALPDRELHVLDWTLSSCATIAGLRDRSGQKGPCSSFLDHALEKSRTLPPVPMILLNRTSDNRDPSAPARYAIAPICSPRRCFPSDRMRISPRSERR
jgi:peptidoglycan/LPS O-acetylase OafA/YrhL